MAAITIPQLPNASAADGSESFPIWQGGQMREMTLAQLLTYVQGSAPSPQPSIAISSAQSNPEGNTGTTAFNYTVTLTRNGSTASLPFIWSVAGSGSNPANAADFGGTFPSGSGTFAAGETSKTIQILASGDTAVEPDEAFTLSVTLTGYNTVTAQGTIINDDSAGATAIPAQSALVERWDVADITPVADGTAVQTWTGKNGYALTQATAGNRPAYKTNRFNGKASLAFTGSQWLVGAGGTACETAINSGNFTMAVIYGNVAATTYGYILNTSASTGANVIDNGTTIGGASAQGSLNLASTSGLHVGALAGSTAYYGLGTVVEQWYDGTKYSQGGSIGNAGDKVAVGAAYSQSFTGASCEVVEILFWNRRLTLVEMNQLQKYMGDKYAVTHPAIAAGKYVVMTGDSITLGFGAASQSNDSYPRKAAQTNNLPMGAWSNIGFGGATPSQIGTFSNGEIAGLAALLGVPVHAWYFEFYNQRSNTLSQQLFDTKAVLTGLKQTAGATKVLFATTCDYANRGSEKGAYTGYWDTAANRTGYMDGYVPIHTNANIGVDGASPNGSPYGTYFNDGIHLTSAGYTVLAGLMATGGASL